MSTNLLLSSTPCFLRQQLGDRDLCEKLNPDNIYRDLYSESKNDMDNDFIDEYNPDIHPNLSEKVGDYNCYTDKEGNCIGTQNKYNKKACDMINDEEFTKTAIPTVYPNKYLGCLLGPCKDEQKTAQKGIRINGIPFSDCTKDDKHCIDNLHTFEPSKYGLGPGYYNSTTPPTNNFLLKDRYVRKEDMILPPNKSQRIPFFDDNKLFNTNMCRRWCTKVPQCKGYSYLKENKYKKKNSNRWCRHRKEDGTLEQCKLSCTALGEKCKGFTHNSDKMQCGICWKNSPVKGSDIYYEKKDETKNACIYTKDPSANLISYNGPDKIDTRLKKKDPYVYNLSEEQLDSYYINNYYIPSNIEKCEDEDANCAKYFNKRTKIGALSYIASGGKIEKNHKTECGCILNTDNLDQKFIREKPNLLEGFEVGYTTKFLSLLLTILILYLINILIKRK